ncbi:hypothetical protein SOHN41_00147 [Shewanella sp. HN-41]|nr:hypothetical protein SOHN41_00147 [Shewanella sp. HN-41]
MLTQATWVEAGGFLTVGLFCAICAGDFFSPFVARFCSP